MRNDPATAPSSTPKRTVHWAVRMNRRNRTWFSLLVLATVGSHLLGQAYPAHYWVLALLQFVVYPQLVYFAAVHSKDQRRAEMGFLMLDGF